jgi:hypothetical protein
MIVDITKKRQEIIKKEEQDQLDRTASIEILTKCLFLINMNNLEELKDLKKHIKQTIKDLKNKK